MLHEVTVVLSDPRVRKSGRQIRHTELFAIEKMHSALSGLAGFRFQYINEHCGLPKMLGSFPRHFVFNLCDRGFQNDPKMEAHIPSLLDILGIPYSGAAPACLATCSDKALVCCLAHTLGIPVPRHIYFPPGKPISARDIPYPILMEAADSDGSIVSVDDAAASTADEVASAVACCRSIIPNASFSMQEHLAGCEYSVGIIGNLGSGLNILPILEVETECAELDRSRSVIPYPRRREKSAAIGEFPRYREARLSAVIRRRLVEYATTLFERLRCRDYARVDFRADHLGEIKLQGVEPNPDWRWDGKLAAMARFQGLHYAGMLRNILVTAMARAAQIQKPQRAEPAQPDFPKPRTALRTISA